MAKISLRTYNREIEGLIEQSQRLDEAIAHCRHILKTYPKHLETYRLLGKAYLEAKRYEEAVDIFQRVLVAAPDDFVSHVGMSIIADDKGKLDDAIWHMERAFEVQPSNAAIQSELQRLFGRRDGVQPPKIRLTRGALAHMYVQGELYTQAISEIRAVLSNDPKRTDMQTLLARAYFRNGQKTEASDICSELLGRYLYCLDANRLMTEIVAGTQKADTAPQYRQRVIEMDPYAAFVQGSLFHTETVGDNLVNLEHLEYSSAAAEVSPNLGIGLEPETTVTGRTPAPAPEAPNVPAPASAGELPSWLRGAADDSGAQPMGTTAVPPSAGNEELPEFLRQAGWETTPQEAAPEAPAPVSPEPEAGSEMGAAVEGELPEWVKALAPSEAQETPPTASTPATPPIVGDILGAGALAAGAGLAAETPEWLRDLGEQTPPPAEPMPEQAQPPAIPPTPDALPDWMQDLGPAPSAPAAEAGAEPPQESPDWLKGLEGRELDEPATPAKGESESDWLGALRAEQPPAAAPGPEAEESPAWLKEFSNDLETPIAKSAPAEPPAATPVQAPGMETPGNLGALGTTAQEQDDAMAWLESLAAKHGAKPEELVTDPNARTEVAPEWVDKAKALGEQKGQQTKPLASDETGVWLRNLTAAEVAAESVTAMPPEAEAPKADEPKVEAPQVEAPTVEEPAVELPHVDSWQTSPEEVPEEQPFDIRSGFAEQNIFAETEAKAEPPSPLIPDDMEAPDWLKDFVPRPVPRSGLEDAPDWLRAPSEEPAEPGQPAVGERAGAERPTVPSPFPPAAEEAEPAQAAEGTELPAWLAGLEQESAAAGPSPIVGQPSDELPAWLQMEAEPEPEIKEPANPADWRPIQPEGPDLEPPAAEPEPEPMVAETPLPPVPQAPPAAAEQMPPPPIPEAPPVAAVEQKPPAPVYARQDRPTVPVPRPLPPRPKPVTAAPKPAMLSLGDAQSQLGRGNIAAALDIYGRLIRKGKSLEDIIRDLREALYRYPVEVPLWQSLGDAYMRANRLQEALDAYTKAEELLR
ncbi:MAG TPA: tetratricopeptide repeat protein [Anaerolineales bacterium]